MKKYYIRMCYTADFNKTSNSSKKITEISVIKIEKDRRKIDSIFFEFIVVHEPDFAYDKCDWSQC